MVLDDPLKLKADNKFAETIKQMEEAKGRKKNRELEKLVKKQK